MNPEATSKKTEDQTKSDALLRALDRGIDDMEAGREMPVEDAFQNITKWRDSSRNVR